MSTAPAPQHQTTVARLFRVLDDFVSSRKLGRVYLAPIDVVLTQRRTVQPDLMFIAKKNQSIVQDAIRGVPDLVVEVVSKGTWRRDRIEKKALYEQFGVKEYWTVDREAETTELLFLSAGAYRLEDKGISGELVKSKLLKGLNVSVRSLFSA